MARKLMLWTALGAALTYFFDPQNGRRRRAFLRDRTPAVSRRLVRRTERAGRAAKARAYGLSRKAAHLRAEPKDYDDATLAHKVETEIFRGPGVPKGQINVNAENGIVYLRGELQDPEMIDDLGTKTRKVRGVRAVENLLHTPGSPAPTRH